MIYDCFLYYDEDMILDIRLNTLFESVDKFVIVESTHTFTGKPRKLHFDIRKYSKFKDKIIYIVHDESPIEKVSEKFNQDRVIDPWAPELFEVDAWANEESQRNKIMHGLRQAQDDDIILVSDVDEIFKPDALKRIRPTKLCSTIYMNFYNYQFNLQVFNKDLSPRQCKAPKAVTFKNLKSFFGGKPETLRNIKKSPLKKCFFKWNWYKFNNQIITDGGWHFSWIMTPERISEKMSSISHTEYDLPHINNHSYIIDVLTHAKDIWGRDRTLIKQDVNKENLPEHIVNNVKKFQSFIL